MSSGLCLRDIHFLNVLPLNTVVVGSRFPKEELGGGDTSNLSSHPLHCFPGRHDTTSSAESFKTPGTSCMKCDFFFQAHKRTRVRMFVSFVLWSQCSQQCPSLGECSQGLCNS